MKRWYSEFKNSMKIRDYFNIIVLVCFTIIIVSYVNYKVSEVPLKVESQINSAVDKIYLAIKNGKISNVKTASLQHKGNFYYLEGKMVGKSFMINDYYDYDVSYPNEIWYGYLTHVIASNNTHYFLWSEDKIESRNPNIKGWFLSDGLSKFQYTEKYDTMYLNVIYPIVSRKAFTP